MQLHKMEDSLNLHVKPLIIREPSMLAVWKGFAIQILPCSQSRGDHAHSPHPAEAAHSSYCTRKQTPMLSSCA